MNQMEYIETGLLPDINDISFVIIRRDTHSCKRELFINLFDAFERLKEITNRLDLEVDNVEFEYKTIPTDIFRSDYICKIKR